MHRPQGLCSWNKPVVRVRVFLGFNPRATVMPPNGLDWGKRVQGTWQESVLGTA